MPLATYIEQIRSQFPALQERTPSGRAPIYFDNPAGTQVPQQTIDAVAHYYRTMNANSGGAFATSRRSDEMVLAARSAMADFLNAPNPQEIVFGPNMTTLNFALSRALGKTLKAGDEIVLTMMDHDANISPWLRIAEDYGLVVRWVDILTEDCTLDMGSLEAALSERTRIVATVHASNAVGTINPVEQIAEMVHVVGAYYVVDAVQSAPHVPLDVQAIGCDFLLCSAYKFYGPHVGILWGRYELLESLPAYKVRPAKNKAPYRWETGTPSFETIAGTLATLAYFASLGQHYGTAYSDKFAQFGARRRDFKLAMSVMAEYERGLVGHLIAGLQGIAGIEIAGITEPERFHQRVPTVVCNLPKHSPLEVATYLAEHDIYVWDGNYYAQAIMERLGKEESGGMVRIGLAHYNTVAEIDRLIEVLGQLA